MTASAIRSITPDQPNRPSRRRRAVLATALSLSLAGGVFGEAGLAAAQDGTGAATPTPPSTCEPVAVGAGESATPAESPAVTAAATPAATPGATPATLELGPAPSDPLAQDLEAAATAIAGCLSDGNYDTLAQMTGDAYRGQLFGMAAPLDAATFAGLAPTLPQVAYQVLSVENVTETGETSATAEVTYQLAHQLRAGTWTFTQQDVGGETVWILDSETAMPAPVPDDATPVDVQIASNAYTLSTSSVAGNAVALTATNADSVDHELLVLRLADGMTTQDLLQSYGPTLPEGIAFVGQVTIAAGGEGTLVLTGLQPGTYTIVCLLPDANGTPYLVNGMETTFAVE